MHSQPSIPSFLGVFWSIMWAIQQFLPCLIFPLAVLSVPGQNGRQPASSALPTFPLSISRSRWRTYQGLLSSQPYTLQLYQFSGRHGGKPSSSHPPNLSPSNFGSFSVNIVGNTGVLVLTAMSQAVQRISR